MIESFKHLEEIARDRDRFRSWIDEHVMKQGPEAFRAHSRRVRS